MACGIDAVREPLKNKQKTLWALSASSREAINNPQFVETQAATATLADSACRITNCTDHRRPRPHRADLLLRPGLHIHLDRVREVREISREETLPLRGQIHPPQ
jgi:hypothetical protein